ncbi:hypothetical protein Poly30_00480 [Planctomycetes bacterium Poly30]|uniref:Uncharacterized protein n=1 Tax=Saltatorellus ferox TaxID=2528018 RepID=A0A518EKD3_9BACT|nr:hypothetical protein Poly30_00480 [Planctomycetes bacterium Poly30]
MRRFLILFIVLFGGAAALWHFEGERRSSMDRSSQVTMTEPTDPVGATTRRARTSDGETGDPSASADPNLAGTDPRDEPEERVTRIGDLEVHEGEGAIFLGSGTDIINPERPGDNRIHVSVGDLVPLNRVGYWYDAMEVGVDSYIVPVFDGDAPPIDEDKEADLSSRVQADRMRVELKKSGIGSGILRDNLDVDLFGVAVEVFRGTAFAPVTFDAPHLKVDFKTEFLRSIGDDRVEFRSRDIHGHGSGLEARVQENDVAFLRGADVQVDLGDDRLLKVSTPGNGPLRLVDLTTAAEQGGAAVTQGPREMLISVEQGVHVELRLDDGISPTLGTPEALELEDERDPAFLGTGVRQPLIIDAESVELRLLVERREIDGEKVQPLIQVARAKGAVTIRQGRDVYRGDSARVLFENGVAVRVVIEKEPSLSYILREDSGQEVELKMSGRGPVTVNLASAATAKSELRFVFTGPGRIDASGRGGIITFENEARGNGARDRSLATIILAGDVRVETPQGAMTSNALIATYRAGQDLRVAADGSTLIVGRDPETGAQYHVRADGGMNAHLVGDGWYVDRARDVYAESFSDEPHRVRAGLITDVDVSSGTLSASGSILYESLWGRAIAKKALVRTADSVTLLGTAAEPVELDLMSGEQGMIDADADASSVRSGWVRATEIRLDATEVIAQGSVAAQVETIDGVWGFDAHELSVRREVTGQSFVLDGESAEPSVGSFRAGQREDVYVTARFVREARYDTLTGNSVIAADRIEMEAGAAQSENASGDDSVNRPLLDPSRAAILRAFGRVSVHMESYGPELDSRGLPTVQQTWNLAASSAVFERQPGAGRAGDPFPFELTAKEVTECRVAGPSQLVEMSATRVRINGEFGALDTTAPSQELDLSGSVIRAEGSVDLRYKSQADQPAMTARCHRLVLEGGEKGRMESNRFRVKVSGIVPGNGLKYELEATVVHFTKTKLIADAPEGAKVVVELASPVRVESFGFVVDKITTDKLTVTPDWISLEGESLLTGSNGPAGPVKWKVADLTVRTEDLKLLQESPKTIGPFDPVPPQDDDDDDDDEDGLEGLITQSGPMVVEYGEILQASGTIRGLDPESGAPIFDNAVVELLQQDITMDAEWIALNINQYTLDAGRGAIRGGGESPWTLAFAGIETRQFADELMITITAPRVTYGQDSARADYLAFWVDRARWEALGNSVIPNEGASDASSPSSVETGEPRPNFLAEILFELQDREYGGYLRALYMEGGVEVIRGDRRAARGSKLYIDLPKAVAWLEDAELVYPLMSRGKEVPLRIRTKRLGTDEEGKLTADNATLTTCDHDVPHFVVRTRKFSLEPRSDGRWRFSARGNRLKFTDGVALPLPSIGNLVLDEEFGIEGFENEAGEVTPLRDIGVAQTARFGTVLGAAFRFDVGKIGSWLAERIGMDSSKLRGKWETEAQYLSGRGPLLGLGLQLRERKPGDDPDEDFRLDAFVGGIVDGGRDRGSIRVPVDERDDLRVSGYMRARYPVVRGEWFDFAFASQTDAAVQSEFYEGDFLRFEQRDTFVRWRKSLGADYLAAGAQKRVNNFRSQKEELPSFAAYRGEREIGTFTGVPLLWGGSFDVGYFRRLEGVAGRDLFSDLPGGAVAGIDDRELGRADLRQRVSLPVQTTLAGIKATPFAEARGTVWTDSLDGGEDPRRASLRTGLELSTTLHKVTDNGYLHALAPRLAYSTDVASSQTGGSLVPLDPTELPLDGTRYEAGLRSLWQRPGTFENLDVDLRTIFLENRDNGLEDSTQLATLAQYITRYGDGIGQIGVRHDARYDLETSATTYSRSALAIRPNDAFLIEFRYSQARAVDDSELYETGGILGRWRLDPKWELESRYIHDMKNDQQLLTELTVRRYAHDFVFDITFQDRSGEGGTNLSFNLVPLLGWTAQRLGMLDRPDAAR